MISSVTFFAGRSTGTASTLVIEAMKITGSKSFAASKLIDLNSALLMAITPVVAIRIVYPSAGDFATASAPMFPDAPARFSTTAG